MKQNLSVDVPASQFGAAVQDMVQALNYGSFEPALKECIDIAHKSIAENFANQSSPHGGPWAPRKSKKTGKGTWENGRLQGSHPLEILTGTLFQAETSDFGAGHVQDIGYREAFTGVDSGEVPWAGPQNFGNPAQNLPARLSEDVSDEAVDRMADEVADRGIELLMGLD